MQVVAVLRDISSRSCGVLIPVTSSVELMSLCQNILSNKPYLCCNLESSLFALQYLPYYKAL